MRYTVGTSLSFNIVVGISFRRRSLAGTHYLLIANSGDARVKPLPFHFKADIELRANVKSRN